MPPAVAAILEGMPDPRDLRRVSADGETLIFAGSRLLFRYRDGDAGARNVAVAVLRQLGYSGQAVAAAMGLTVNYVATLHQRALREGTGGAGPAAGPAGQAGAGRVGSGRGNGGRPGRAMRRSPAAWGWSQSTVCGGSAPPARRTSCRCEAADAGGSRHRSREPRGRNRGRRMPARQSRSRSPGGRARRRPAAPGRTAPGTAGAGDGAAAPPGRGSPAARSRPGMRARCCCTPSAAGPAPGRSWPRRRAADARR